MKSIIYVILVLLFFSCQGQENAKTNYELVVDKTITFSLVKKGETIWLNTFPKLLEDAKLLTFDAGNTKNKIIEVKDTLEVITGDIKAYHNFYLLNPGDSVNIDFLDIKPAYLLKNKNLKFGSPYLTITNRKIKPFELNFCYYLNLNKRLGINMYRSELSKRKYAAEKLPPIISTKQSYNLSLNFLDSLKNNGLFTANAYSIYKNYLQAEYYSTLLYLKKDIDEIDKAFLNQPTLLKYHFYRSFLELYIEGALITDLNLDNIDYTKAYDLSNRNFKGSIKEYLLTHYLLKIKETNPIKFPSYLQLFNHEVKNAEYKNYINKNFNNKLLSGNVGKTSIINAINKGDKKNYIEHLTTLKGNVVFVDLWASWCMPCREAMPASLKLRNAYGNRKVVFMYLSIDDKLTAWEGANKQEGLDSYKNSFLMLSTKDNTLLKQLNVKTIPRYLIYNKKGELVNANAPGPDSPKLKDLLDQYLTEK